MSRVLVCVSVLVLAACGVTPSEESRDDRNCTAQTDCDPDWRKVCEDGYCSATLPANSEMDAEDKVFIYASQLNIGLDRKVKYSDDKVSFRAVVVYPVTPEGKTVTCSNIASYEQLGDPSKYNLTARPWEKSNLKLPQGQVIQGQVFLNGPGRVLYVEIYDGALEENPKVVGVACLENAAPNEDGKIGMTAKPPV